MPTGDRAVEVVGRIHARLREDIITGRLPAGKPLATQPLADSLGVSRTPLREAFRLLEREGLVTSEHNKRVRVSNYSVSDLEELYALRITIEAAGARIASLTATSDDDAELARLEVVMCEAAGRQDYDAWAEPHRAFHRGIISRSGPRFCRLADELSDHAERYRHAYTTQWTAAWENGIQEHRAILVAYQARDADELAAALAKHYARVALTALSVLAPEHEPVRVREALRACLAKATVIL